ncbi:hypothetical protein [Sphingorhabdus sp. YGSMI21]|uniref:GTA baseplate fiber-binding domain-containing protein n=1 Tax=Sphingorhabdus sp. YGSMI21 TaxID=2077182 RepID=UPI0013DD6081|nr:hypothetical protein [Sphingorhabdus sp. YGSMI21]
MALVRDFPAAISADQAKKLATIGLWSEYAERSILQVSLPLSSCLYRPAMLVEIAGFTGLWRVRECEIGSGSAQLSLIRMRADKALLNVESDQGRIISDPDLRAGLTRLILVDLPFALVAPTAVSDSAKLYAAAAGEPGWRNAQLFASGPEDASGEYVGQIPAATVLGTTVGTLATANPSLIDQINQIEVALHNPQMNLVQADDGRLLAGHNIALIGREIIQFAVAIPLGDGRFRLSRLIRGLGGTEAEIATHGAGEDFVLLDGGSMLEIGPAFYAPFTPAIFHAVGRDDPAPVSAMLDSPGRALLPWSPVHPEWQFLDGGDLQIRWTRRSRAGTIWSDHVDVPLAEEVEQYRIELAADGGSAASVSLETPEEQAILSASQIAPFISGNSTNIDVRIFQIGASGRSVALAFAIPL